MQMPFLGWRSKPPAFYGEITNNFGENKREQKRSSERPQIEESQAGLRAGIKLTRDGKIRDENSKIRNRSMLGRLSYPNYKAMRGEQVFSL
jgi:hypothetical protein